MFVIRFSYFLMPANRNKAIEMIRQEVEAAKAKGIESRLLIPLSRGRGGAALEYEIEVSQLDALEEFRHKAIGESEEITHGWMREFSDFLSEPPVVNLFRRDEGGGT